MLKQKSKQKIKDKQKQSYTNLPFNGSDLYYIASKEDLLKKFTMSFYNMETRKSNKQIVMEKVGNIGIKNKKEEPVLNNIENKQKNERNERKSHKYSPDSKNSRLKHHLSKIMTSDTQSTLLSDPNRLMKKNMRSASPVFKRDIKLSHTKIQSVNEGSKQSK